MTSSASGAPGAPILPDYAPVPPASLGPAVNGQGYYVGRVERNLYWVTDGDYHSAFLTTRDGVVLFDAPPSIGRNLQRAVNQAAAAEGVSDTVTHLIYTHHHAVLRQMRRQPLGRRQGPAGCGGGRRRRARHQEVHRRAGSRRCVHRSRRLLDPGVDPARPRLPHGRSPMSKP
jgi:hypothetical protein